MGSNESQGKANKNKARLSNYENLLSQEQKEKENNLEIFIPAGLD